MDSNLSLNNINYPSYLSLNGKLTQTMVLESVFHNKKVQEERNAYRLVFTLQSINYLNQKAKKTSLSGPGLEPRIVDRLGNAFWQLNVKQ